MSPRGFNGLPYLPCASGPADHFSFSLRRNILAGWPRTRHRWIRSLWGSWTQHSLGRWAKDQTRPGEAGSAQLVSHTLSAHKASPHHTGRPKTQARWSGPHRTTCPWGRWPSPLNPAAQVGQRPRWGNLDPTRYGLSSPGAHKPETTMQAGQGPGPGDPVLVKPSASEAHGPSNHCIDCTRFQARWPRPCWKPCPWGSRICPPPCRPCEGPGLDDQGPAILPHNWGSRTHSPKMAPATFKHHVGLNSWVRRQGCTPYHQLKLLAARKLKASVHILS